MRLVILLVISACTLGAACKVLPEDRGSAFASEAGQSTLAIMADPSNTLGSCQGGFQVGWTQCLLEKNQPEFPKLVMAMTNPGDWAVSDCAFGLYKSGSVSEPGIVEVDLSGLKEQANHNGICILKIEATERYPDPKDKKQLRSIFMRGGFFVELVEPGYFPIPANDVIAFCAKVMRTTKGRTKIESCQP